MDIKAFILMILIMIGMYFLFKHHAPFNACLESQMRNGVDIDTAHSICAPELRRND